MDSRLSNDKSYVRPEKTFQESLSQEEIKEKLKDYKKVEDISKVPVNSHLRYFSLIEDPKTKKTKKVFRMGGLLKNKDNYDKYVILTNGKQSWSVNTQKSVFFKKMNTDDIHVKYQDEISELKKIIKKLKN